MAEKKNLTDVFKERKGKAETDAQSGTSAVEKLTQSGLPPSRQGKRRLELWLSPDAKKQVKLIAVDEEKSQEQVMAEALNEYFRGAWFTANRLTIVAIVPSNQKATCLFFAHLIHS